jgi:hypothetical protein
MKMVNMALPKFEVAGGLVSGTEESRGIISIDRPNRQWGKWYFILAPDGGTDDQITPSAGRLIRS